MVKYTDDENGRDRGIKGLKVTKFEWNRRIEIGFVCPWIAQEDLTTVNRVYG